MAGLPRRSGLARRARPAGVRRGLHRLAEIERTLDALERLPGASAPRHDDLAVAEQPAGQALGDLDPFDLGQQELDRAGVEHAELDDDALVGDRELGAPPAE